MVIDTGARDQREATIDALTGPAIAAREAAPIDPQARTALTEPAEFVAWHNTGTRRGRPQGQGRANNASASGRVPSITPGSCTTASSHGGRLTPTTARAVSRPLRVLAWRAKVAA